VIEHIVKGKNTTKFITSTKKLQESFTSDAILYLWYYMHLDISSNFAHYALRTIDSLLGLSEKRNLHKGQARKFILDILATS